MANSRSKLITQVRYVLPGSNESGVPCAAKVRVPPLRSEGLTTPDRPPLNAASVLGAEPLVLALALPPPATDPPPGDPPWPECPDASRPATVPAAATRTAAASAA